MIIHIGAKNQIADTVLLLCDPLRQSGCNRFLSNVTEVNTVRGMLDIPALGKKISNNTRFRNGDAFSIHLC